MKTKSKVVSGDICLDRTGAMFIQKDCKSIIKIGNIIIYNTKKFNSFQKKMIKLFFGFEVQDYE